MAPPHIISWGDNERSSSPVSTTSLVSIDSILSDTSSTVPEAPRATQSKAKSMSFPVFLGKRESGVHLSNHDPFMRHDKYYFKDGNITFLVRLCLIAWSSAYCPTQVDGTLYCVHRYFFCRDSTYFSTRLDQLSIREHEFLAIIISLGDVERKDFEAFLSVIYPECVTNPFVLLFGLLRSAYLPVISKNMASRMNSGSLSSTFPLAGVSRRSADWL